MIVMKRKSRDRIARVKLTKESGFPGVILDFQEFTLLEKETKDGKNSQLRYKVVSVPKDRYKNLDDSKEKEFENVVEQVFVDIVSDVVQEMNRLKKASKTK